MVDSFRHPVAIGVTVLLLVGAVWLLLIISKAWRRRKGIHVRNDHEEDPMGKDGDMKP